MRRGERQNRYKGIVKIVNMQNMKAKKFFFILFVFIAIPSCWTWILSFRLNRSQFKRFSTAYQPHRWCLHVYAHSFENHPANIAMVSKSVDCMANARVLICRAVCQNFRQPTFEQIQLWFIGKALEFGWKCVFCALDKILHIELKMRVCLCIHRRYIHGELCNLWESKYTFHELHLQCTKAKNEILWKLYFAYFYSLRLNF